MMLKVTPKRPIADVPPGDIPKLEKRAIARGADSFMVHLIPASGAIVSVLYHQIDSNKL
jgi:hypothetical protein